MGQVAVVLMGHRGASVSVPKAAGSHGGLWAESGLLYVSGIPPWLSQGALGEGRGRHIFKAVLGSPVPLIVFLDLNVFLDVLNLGPLRLCPSPTMGSRWTVLSYSCFQKPLGVTFGLHLGEEEFSGVARVFYVGTPTPKGRDITLLPHWPSPRPEEVTAGWPECSRRPGNPHGRLPSPRKQPPGTGGADTSLPQQRVRAGGFLEEVVQTQRQSPVVPPDLCPKLTAVSGREAGVGGGCLSFLIHCPPSFFLSSCRP